MNEVNVVISAGIADENISMPEWSNVEKYSIKV